MKNHIKKLNIFSITKERMKSKNAKGINNNVAKNAIVWNVSCVYEKSCQIKVQTIIKTNKIKGIKEIKNDFLTSDLFFFIFLIRFCSLKRYCRDNIFLLKPFKEFRVVINSSGTFNYTYIYDDGSILIARINPDGSKWYYQSNLYKFNNSQWYLYVNQSDSSGTYDYQAFATIDSVEYATDARTITFY